MAPDGTVTAHDAFSFVPTEEYDVLIVDPLYEDALPYLALVAPHVRAKYFVVQSGRNCDFRWNAEAEKLLGYGSVEKPNENTFGAKIFLVTRN